MVCRLLCCEAFGPPQVDLLPDFFIELAERYAHVLLAAITHEIVDLHILGNDDALVNRIIFPVVVVNQRLAISADTDAHLGFD